MNSSRHVRTLVVTVAAAAMLSAGLSACQRKDKKETPPAPPASAHAIEGPLKYDSSTPYAKVSLTLPVAVLSYPTLYTPLYRDEVAKLKEYAEGAQADRTEAGSTEGMPPYEKTIVYNAPIETGRLFSLMRIDFDYSGGAHPNTVATGLLWDKAEGRRIAASDLFGEKADKTNLERALCQAVNTAKTKRPGAEPVSTTGDMWTCPKLKDVAVTVAPGTIPGKAGGLTFLLDAYAVGPYVEGPYYLTLPLSAFQSALSPEYAGEFAGEPAKTGDVTEDLRLKAPAA